MTNAVLIIALLAIAGGFAALSIIEERAHRKHVKQLELLKKTEVGPYVC